MKINVLISFWYYRDVDLDAYFGRFAEPPRVFADSGAFSAYSQGKPLDVAEYADWLHRWRQHFAHYANLDVKGDVAAGLRHQAELERRGLTPIPVFHGGEPFSVLEDFVAQYPYVAIGGIAGGVLPSSHRQVSALLARCFTIGQGTCVFHAFGMTSLPQLLAFPWFSADSSSWGAGFRYGQCNVFDPSRGKIRHMRVTNRPEWRQYAHLVRQHGFDPLFLGSQDARDLTSRCQIAGLGAAAYFLAGEYIRRHRRPVPLAGDDPGFHLHLSTAGACHEHHALKGLSFMERQPGGALALPPGRRLEATFFPDPDVAPVRGSRNQERAAV